MALTVETHLAATERSFDRRNGRPYNPAAGTDGPTFETGNHLDT